jgi:hypothetical protein
MRTRCVDDAGNAPDDLTFGVALGVGFLAIVITPHMGLPA